MSAYLSAITSYFAIFVDNLKSGETFATMKDSPVDGEHFTIEGSLETSQRIT